MNSVTIPDGVITIGECAFEWCDSLSSIEIPQSVTTIGESAFGSCTQLSSVTIGQSVTDIGRSAFGGCSSLVTVTIPDNVKQIESFAFKNCSSLTSATIGASVIGDNAFLNCKKLAAISIGKNVSRIDQNAFKGCTGLKDVYIKDLSGWCNIDYVDDTAIPMSYAKNLYLNDVLVTDIKIPDGVTTIKPWSFAFCTSLTSVTIPGSVSTIGASAFAFCTELASVSIDNGVSVVGERAFSCCFGLASINIPQSVTQIDLKAFSTDSNLSTILFEGNAPLIGEQVFAGVTATASYPDNDPTWTEEVRQNYGGTITWVAYASEAEKFDIDVARMILGNALEFQFGVAKSKFTDLTGIYAVVEKSWADGTTTTLTIPASQWDAAGQYYAIVYNGMAAKEMADTFNVTIYKAEGEAISNSRTDSVRDYVMRSIDGQTEKGKTMLVDMLNYGAAAQQSFKYNTTDLANNRLSSTQKAWGTKNAAATTNNLVEGTNYKGTRLVLESSIQMQIAFTGMNRTMYAVYNYTDHNGTAQRVTVKGEDFIEVSGLYGIELTELVYANARQIVTVQIYNSKGKLLSTVQDSIESYVNRSGATAPLFEALMKFTDSAKVYLHQ